MSNDKRMFEHADEGKFWEIWADGSEVFTRFGKTGSKGQTKVKKETDTAGAIAKMIKDKTADGYAQTGGEVDAGPALDKKELKRHLGNIKTLTADDPGFLVLADWLQQQEHPWGELIALQHGAATNAKKTASLSKQADKHLAQNGPAILGALANARSFPNSHFTWHCGFLRSAVVGADAKDPKALPAAIKELLALPCAHLIEGVVMAPVPQTFTTYRDWGQSEENLVDPWTDLEKLAKLVPDRVTHVGFGEWPGSAAAAYSEMPSFAKISTAFPDLVHLEITGFGGEKLGKLSLKNLERLDVRFAQAAPAHLTALASCKLPKLTHLNVWLGGTSNVCVDDVYSPDEWDEDNEDNLRYPASYSAADLEGMGNYGVEGRVGEADISTFLAEKLLDKVTHLGISSAAKMTEDIVAAIAKSPAVKRAKVLDLSRGSLDDDGANALVKAKKSLAHLESIDLRGTRITPAAAKKVKQALPNAVLPGGDPVEEHDFHFRYVATVE